MHSTRSSLERWSPLARARAPCVCLRDFPSALAEGPNRATAVVAVSPLLAGSPLNCLSPLALARGPPAFPNPAPAAVAISPVYSHGFHSWLRVSPRACARAGHRVADPHRGPGFPSRLREGPCVCLRDFPSALADGPNRALLWLRFPPCIRAVSTLGCQFPLALARGPELCPPGGPMRDSHPFHFFSHPLSPSPSTTSTPAPTKTRPVPPLPTLYSHPEVILHHETQKPPPARRPQNP